VVPKQDRFTIERPPLPARNALNDLDDEDFD
jgi:hypothetical protein